MRFLTSAQSPTCDHTILALLATPSFPISRRQQMSGPYNDSTPNSLPEELDRALKRATDRTLIALTSLRKAVRKHVEDEKDAGATLPEIELELRAIIAKVLEDAEGRDSIDGERDTLATQMIKWSEGFYKKKD
jgi:hypothetical protein